MTFLHVECLPDETLAKKLGFVRKQIIHHSGKSRVFSDIRKKSKQLAIVDEDPGQAKNPYENELILKEEAHGVSYFLDNKRKNKVFVLKIKLEDWILEACKKEKLKLDEFGLPKKSNDLHEVINNRLIAFEKLLDNLKRNNNASIITLETWLHSTEI
jgi:hypothetical protein